ncbi:MAG: M20/M25/M40 family metallo-hydrolase [Thermoflexales bacterium]|nr:M20/M25/M40 family metallo-hydrolase [Thermoflexales bacterium]MBP8241347.1 M20/M25/M40 family metallo-hydrolase [Thermoflexales bacterium]
MSLSATEVARDLIAIPSVSSMSNAEVSQYAHDVLLREGFEVERLSYDDHGLEKVSLVARKGAGQGGIGFFSHSDTVPGDVGWAPFDPVIANGRLYGRGSCDMKGPLAATMAAAANFDVKALKRPVYVVVTADEEVGYGGAYQVAAESKLFAESWPEYGVVAEPTRLRPVYSHKGGALVTVHALGAAAHSSTEKGVSANFKIAPFLAEMAALVPVFRTDPRFLNPEFSPPSFGFNMIVTDYGTKSNVTAPRTTALLSLRDMPNVDNDGAVALLVDAAKRHGLEVEVKRNPYFYVRPDSEMVRMACEACGGIAPETVAFGTEAIVFESKLPRQVVLGPGDIAQAHTVGEFIDVAQLEQAVAVYQRLIERACG